MDDNDQPELRHATEESGVIMGLAETKKARNRMAAANKRVPIKWSVNVRAQPLHLTNMRNVDTSNSNQLDLQSAPDSRVKTFSRNN